MISNGEWKRSYTMYIEIEIVQTFQKLWVYLCPICTKKQYRFVFSSSEYPHEVMFDNNEMHSTTHCHSNINPSKFILQKGLFTEVNPGYRGPLYQTIKHQHVLSSVADVKTSWCFIVCCQPFFKKEIWVKSIRTGTPVSTPDSYPIFSYYYPRPSSYIQWSPINAATMFR